MCVIYFRAQCFRRFVGPSDKSGKNRLGPVKVRIVTDQMSGNVEAMKTGRIMINE